MGDDAAHGLGSALEAAIEQSGPILPLVDGEQLAMLTDLGLAATDPRQAAEAALREARGRGRPRGSMNRRTGKVRDYLLSKYAHPLEVLAQTYTRSPAELAAELGCSKHEAFVIQQRAAAELAPYLESKMATVVDMTNRQQVAVIIPGFNAPIGSTMAELEHMALDPETLDLEVLPSPGAQVLDGQTGAQVDRAT